MAASNNYLGFIASIMLVSTFNISLAHPGLGYGFGWGGSGGGGGGGGDGDGDDYLSFSPNFYDYSCPQANDIVLSVLETAIAKDPRMAASLLRLHFHDCFIKGCDASVLLDDTNPFVSEKSAAPNVNSLRGYEVVDKIKAQLEEACPETVSCADILAFAARGSTVLSGGPYWELPLGRRDSMAAYFKLANTTLPSPRFTVQQLVQNFKTRGLDEVDLVALSGGHTIGMSKCSSFKRRLYNQNGTSRPDVSLEREFLTELKSTCPPTGGDTNTSPLDYSTPKSFDNTYFKLILGGRGLLFSDQQLFSGNFPNVAHLVKTYAQDETLFFDNFAKSMIKMGSLSPLLGSDGEVRKNCRRVNNDY